MRYETIPTKVDAWQYTGKKDEPILLAIIEQQGGSAFATAAEKHEGETLAPRKLYVEGVRGFGNYEPVTAGDWIVRLQNGLWATYTDAEFQAMYRAVTA